jgi:Fe-S-cluster-containing hydrogenase component 2
MEEIGIDSPVVCQHCRERYCVKCPESAIQVGPLGQIIVSPTLCTVCGTCEKLCPIGAIELYNEIPYVCDLCGGNPRCVKECNLGAIWFDPQASETVSLEEFRKESRGLSPQKRRVSFVLKSTRALRDKWIKERSA